MQNEWLLFFLQYLFAVVATGAVYFVGNFLLNYVPLCLNESNNAYQKPYTAMVLGLVAIVLFYSLIITHGKTINILFLPILFLLLISNKKKKTLISLDIDSKKKPLLFLCGSCAFFLIIFHLFPESENQQKDATFYLRVSTAFNYTGEENVFGTATLLGKPFVGTEPYHYFELWWSAILIKCFSNFLPGMQVFRLVSYCTICTGALLGLFALAKSIIIQPLSIFQKLLCVSFLFFMPDLLAFFHFLQPIIIYTFENNMIERPPLRTLYLFLPGLLMALNAKKNEWKVLFWITGAMISSVLYFAVFVPTVFVFCLICTFTIDSKYKRNPLLVLCGVFLFGLLYFLFYHFSQSRLQITSSGIRITTLITYFLRYWKIISLATTTSLITCLWLPILLLLFIYNKNKDLLVSILKNNKPILFLCTCILCGILLARGLNFLDDVYQFAYTADTCAGFMFFVILFNIFNHFNIKKISYVALSVVIIGFYLMQRFIVPQKSYANAFEQNGYYLYGSEKFSEKYLQQIKNVFPKGSVAKGAFWADVRFYDIIFHHSYRNSNVFLLPSSYILDSYLKSNSEFCLSDSADIIHNVNKLEMIPYGYVSSSIKRSAFYQYAAKSNSSLAFNRFSFIKKNKLQYLILTKNADTTIISQLPVTQQFQDNVTGERFYVLGIDK